MLQPKGSPRYRRRGSAPQATRVAAAPAFARFSIRSAFFFDEAFGPGSYIGSGEDSDLMFRAYLAGATLEYVPDMTVFHYHGRKTPEAGRKLMRRYTMANGAMLARYQFTHPDLCRVSIRI